MDFKAYVLTTLGAVAVVTGVFLVSNAATDRDAARLKAFMEKHGREYASPVEFDYRLTVFTENFQFVESQKAKKQSFTVAMNKFADLSWDEFRSFYLMKPVPNPSLSAEEVPYTAAGADSKDWAAEGRVGPVPDQGLCGSCWAFAAVGAMQSAVAIKTNTLEEYSVQELVDCADAYENNGCEGGLPANAYKYIVDKKIALAADYPYTGREQQCAVRDGTARTALAGYEALAQISLAGIIALLMRSPVAIGFEAQRDFMFYHSGIYKGSARCGEELNHGVLLVGFNAAKSEKYFIIQNSWGDDWGESGFVRMAFGTKKSGTCGMINSMDVIPLLEVPA